MDFSVQTETLLGTEDRRWTGERKGYDTCRPIMLKASTFNANHLTKGNAIPSGIVLGVITATGFYGPYDPGASDGRQVAAGHLFTTARVGPRRFGSQPLSQIVDLTTAADVAATLFWEGLVLVRYLPTFAGGVTTGTFANLAAAKASALNNFIRYE